MRIYGHGKLILLSVMMGACHLLTALPAHEYRTYSVAYSPEGRLLATGGYDGAVRLWDYQSGKLLREMETMDPFHRDSTGVPITRYPVEHLLFTRDGSLILSARGPWVEAWETKTGKLAWEYLHFQPVSAMRLSNDGKNLLTSQSWSDIKVWSLGDRSDLRSLELLPQSKLNAVAYAGNIILAGGEAKQLCVWEANEAKPAKYPETVSEQDAEITALEVSPEGKLVAVGGTRRVLKLFDLGRRQYLPQRFPGLTMVTNIKFYADGRHLLVAGTDGAIHLFGVDGSLMRKYDLVAPALAGENGNWIHGLALAPNAKEVAFGTSSGSAGVLRLDTGRIRYFTR